MYWILYLVFFMQLLYIVYVLLEREVQLMVMLVRFVYVQLMMLGVVEGRMVEILVDVVSVVDVVIFVMLQLCGMYVQLGNGVLGLKLIGLFCLILIIFLNVFMMKIIVISVVKFFFVNCVMYFIRVLRLKMIIIKMKFIVYIFIQNCIGMKFQLLFLEI